MELHRSFNSRIIAGVCSGLAETLNIDSIITRFLFGISILWGGAGILVYLILWIILPLKEYQASQVFKFYRPTEGRLLGGVCKGISRMIKVDPAIIRILCIFATIYFGYGIFIYILLWVIIPSENKVNSTELHND